MIRRQFFSRWLALPVLITTALVISACGANLSGEPEIEREAEIITRPTTAPSPTPAEDAAANDVMQGDDADESDSAPDDASPGDGAEGDKPQDDVSQAAASQTDGADDTTQLVQGDYDLGFQVYLNQCASCHGAADGIGPGLATMHTNAPTRVEDLSGAEYVRESIVEPDAYIVEGYNDTMPADFGERLTDEEIAGLVTFVLEFDPARMGMGGDTSGADSAMGSTDSEPDAGTDSDADATPDADDGGAASDVENPEIAATSQSAVGPELAAGETLTVSGELVQGTSRGEEIPSGLPVQVYAVDPHGNLAGVYQGESTEDQRFIFEDVARSVGMTYFIEVQYQGVPQGTRIAPIEGDEQEVSTAITLYERTTNSDAVAITWAEMLVNYAPIEQAGLEVWLDLELANTGDTIVTTDERAEVNDWYVAVEIELPVGAFGIQPMQAENSQRYTVELVDNVPVVKDTWPLRPGQAHTITIAYYLPYETEAVIEHGFNYTVVDGLVLLPNDTVDFESEQFDSEGDWRGRVTDSGASVEALEPNERIDPESDFALIRAHDLLDPVPPGGRLVFELDGRPTRTLDLMTTNPAAVGDGGGDDEDNLLALILAALGVGIIVVAGVMFLRQQRSTPDAAPEQVERRATAPAWRPPPPNATKADLLASLASLDDAYEAGLMDDETYYERRAILSERLVPLLDEDDDPGER